MKFINLADNLFMISLSMKAEISQNKSNVCGLRHVAIKDENILTTPFKLLDNRKTFPHRILMNFDFTLTR